MRLKLAPIITSTVFVFSLTQYSLASTPALGNVGLLVASAAAAPSGAYIPPGVYVPSGSTYVPGNNYYSPGGVYRAPNGQTIPVYPNNYSPYGNIYTPYTPYGNYGYPSSLGYYNGPPIYGPPQLMGGNVYGANVGGTSLQFWRAPSGYYYPWLSGVAYPSSTFYILPPNPESGGTQLPSVSTIVSDLNDYLDKAKEKGKIDEGDFISLKRRASDLLAKEKSLAYEEGGVLSQDSAADIRRDVQELGSEVVRRVKP